MRTVERAKQRARGIGLAREYPGSALSLVVLSGLLFLAGGWSVRADQPAAGQPDASGLLPQQAEFFEKQVRPLLIKRCYGCHAGTKAEGGLSLETAEGWRQGGERGPAVVPGKPEESLLIEAVHYGSLEMPPAEEGGKLPDDEVAILTKWVEMGAPDPREGGGSIGGMSLEKAKSWWAFQPLPAVSGPADPRVIDQLLEKELGRRGLQAAGPADRRTLIRRATYDLVGLPPTAEEVDAFAADDLPGAFERVVDRLLASPEYGAGWGRHWLDVVRYADTAGENTDRPLPHAWRYRNWVFDAFRRDMPFDQFVRLQLAGDILAAEEGDERRAEGIIATGYLAIARRFGHDIDKDMHLTHEDVIDNLGKNFLGLSLGCARCHDHKYDPVGSDDYYALVGIFESTRFAFPGCEPKGQPRDLVPLIDPKEAEQLTAAYKAELARYEEQAGAAPREAKRLSELSAGSVRLLAESAVGEGQTVAIDGTGEGQPAGIAVRKGEVLQLTVLPNGNHGADTTRVELEITPENGGGGRSWNPEGLIDGFTSGGPAIEQEGATWCLLDATDGPLFLREKKENIGDKAGLGGWAIGDTPSSIVNAESEPVDVWTRLPPRAFFVHPGQGRNVAVAWVCPEDGMYLVRGAVSDAHPAGLDGVSFRLEHVASAEYGGGLVALGSAANAELPPRPEPPAIPSAYAVAEAEGKNARFQKRGNPEEPGEEVPRRWLGVFGGEAVRAEGGSGRRQLADWVAGHPLTARVMANRIWEWHFGQGLVRTPNDFGARGEAPTQVELLDWLAGQFAASGYSVKAMHRLILQTAAYQRASATPGEKDAENRWLAHFSRRRLTAEELRDSLLSVSGRLDLTAGDGHPFPKEETWTFTQHNPFSAVYETNRRSAYLMVQRQRRHPFLALFDGADPNASTPVRETTTVPTQALYFLNDAFFHEQAKSFADRLAPLPDDRSRAVFAWRAVYQREPSERELARTEEFLSGYPAEDAEKWAALCRVLLSSNEFLHVD
jgi:hypothetical protein